MIAMRTSAPTSERTARHLQDLYVVGAGLGVAIALGNMITNAESSPDLEVASVPVVFAFLATLVPFFHGAMLYMDEEFTGAPIILIDFLALFSQTVLFFVMAEFIREPTSFVWSWVLLLLVDIVWICWLIWPRRTKGDARERRRRYVPWAVINLITILILVILVALVDWPLGPNLLLAGILALVALARTTADYWWGRKVYFD